MTARRRSTCATSSFATGSGRVLSDLQARSASRWTSTTPLWAGTTSRPRSGQRTNAGWPRCGSSSRTRRARSSRTPRAATSPSVYTAPTGQPTTSPATSATGRISTLPTGTTLRSIARAGSSGGQSLPLPLPLPLPLGEGRGEGCVRHQTFAKIRTPHPRYARPLPEGEAVYSRHGRKAVAVVAADRLVQLGEPGVRLQLEPAGELIPQAHVDSDGFGLLSIAPEPLHQLHHAAF